MRTCLKAKAPMQVGRTRAGLGTGRTPKQVKWDGKGNSRRKRRSKWKGAGREVDGGCAIVAGCISQGAADMSRS